MEGPPIENCSARHCPADKGEAFRKNRTVMGNEKKPVAIGTPNGRVVRVAQLRRRLHQRIEHSLQVERRAADDLEHVGGGSLLRQGLGNSLSGLGKLARTLLKLPL